MQGVENSAEATAVRLAPARVIGGVGGLVFVTTVIIQNVLRGSIAPKTDAAVGKVIEFYADHRSTTMVLAALFVVGAVGGAAFNAGLLARLTAAPRSASSMGRQWMPRLAAARTVEHHFGRVDRVRCRATCSSAVAWGRLAIRAAKMPASSARLIARGPATCSTPVTSTRSANATIAFATSSACAGQRNSSVKKRMSLRPATTAAMSR